MTAKEFLKSLPEKVPAEMLEGIETVFHFDLLGEGEEKGKYTVRVSGGTLDVKEGLEGRANCTVTARSSNLIGVITGELNPMMAVLTGKIKISNQAEMIKYAKIFGIL